MDENAFIPTQASFSLCQIILHYCKSMSNQQFIIQLPEERSTMLVQWLTSNLCVEYKRDENTFIPTQASFNLCQIILHYCKSMSNQQFIIQLPEEKSTVLVQWLTSNLCVEYKRRDENAFIPTKASFSSCQIILKLEVDVKSILHPPEKRGTCRHVFADLFETILLSCKHKKVIELICA